MSEGTRTDRQRRVDALFGADFPQLSEAQRSALSSALWDVVHANIDYSERDNRGSWLVQLRDEFVREHIRARQKYRDEEKAAFFHLVCAYARVVESYGAVPSSHTFVADRASTDFVKLLVAVVATAPAEFHKKHGVAGIVNPESDPDITAWGTFNKAVKRALDAREKGTKCEGLGAMRFAGSWPRTDAAEAAE
jgi:hypothetical protein